MTGVAADPVAAAVCALACGLPSLLVPWLLARLPAPVVADDDRGPNVPLAEIAATPGLGVRSAAGGALAGGVIGLTVGWEWSLLLMLPLVPVGVALAVVDWRTHFLPRQLVLGATAAAVALTGLVWLLDRDTDAVVRAAVGLVVARTAFWLMWFVRASGLGFGDVRLAALLGLVLAHRGWSELLLGLWLGFLTFAVLGTARAVASRDRGSLKEPAPLGPFLLVGAVLGVLLGPSFGGLAAG